jgi:hypothetical protein
MDAKFYRTGGIVTLAFYDPTMNLRPSVAETINVDVSSDFPDAISVTLTETGANTSLFTGTFRLVAENPGANELQVKDGSWISVSYDGVKLGADDGGIATGIAKALVDDSAPTVTIVSPQKNGNISTTTPLVSATVNDGGSGIYIAWLGLDGIIRDTNWADGLSYQVPTVAPLTEGVHTAVVNAVDNAGNVNETSWSFTVDTTKPTCEISMNVSSPVKGNVAIEFTFAFSEDMKASPAPTIAGNATSKMTQVSAGWKDVRTYSANYTVNTAPFNGTVLINATGAVDMAGNVMIPANFTFYIDTVAPTAPTSLNATLLAHSIVLSWNASKDDGSGMKLYNIYMNDTKVGSVNYPTTTFTHTGLMEAGTYIYKVGAVDYAGNEANSTALTVKFVPGVVTEWNITLSEGWNLISLPLIPDNSSIEAVLSGIMEHVDSVWAYNAETGKWLMYDPDTPEISNLHEMKDGVGYWIKMTSNVTLTIHGSEFPAPPATPPVYHVVPGWNLIGYKEVVEMTVKDYLAGVEYVRLWTFVDGRWVAVKETDLMVPGRGYWIAVTEEGWIYP